MNIQIFGTKKNNDSKKVERFFKERNIRYQFVDMQEKGLSKGEFQSVVSAIGDLSELIDGKAKDQETVALIRYLAAEDVAEKLFENQQVMRLPVVRNGKLATVGFQPETWKRWLEG